MYWERVLWETINKNSAVCFFAFTRRAESQLLAENKEPSRPRKAAKKTKTKKYLTLQQYPEIHLTQREAECVSHLLTGKTMAETAKTLNLSARTIEFYMKNVKAKFNCNTRSQLIAAVLKSNFLEKYLEHIRKETQAEDN